MSSFDYAPPPADETPHKISIARGEFIDDSRGGRDVPFKIYYPVAHKFEHLPVVIWSHGLGGSRDGAAFLARFLASHGYVIVNIQHRGTDTTIWEGKPGHPWDVIRKAHISRKVTLDRFKDVPFVLDRLPQWAEENPEAGEHMDLKRLGMSGHSFGAITTQVTAGQKLGKGKRMYSLKENRFRAGICYSPSPTYNHDQPNEETYGGITLPMLYMTGTEDSSPVTGRDYTYRLPIFEKASGPDQHLIVLDGGDHMVFAGSRGKLKDHPKRHIHEDIIKTATLAFWDAFLKENTGAYDWMTKGGLKDWLNGEGTYKFRK